MQRATVTGCVLALVFLMSGCAARSRSTLTARLVKQGTPTIQYGPEARAPEDSFEEVIAKIRALTANGLTRPKNSSLPVIEGRDPELAAALAEARSTPSAEAYVRTGQAYVRLGVRDQAYEQFRQALKIDPRDAAAHDGLARLWRDWGFPDIALGEAHRAVYYAPWSPTANNTLATVLQAVGQTTAAKKAYEYVLLLDPKAAYAANNLCYLALQAADFTSAGARCEQAVALDPSMTTAWINLAAAAARSADTHPKRAALTADAAARAFAAGVRYSHDEQYASAEAAFGAACGLSASGPACERAAQAAEHAQFHQQER